MNQRINLPKWVSLGLLTIFLIAGGLGLINKRKPVKSGMAAVEETMAATADDADAFVFDPKLEPSTDDEPSAGDLPVSTKQSDESKQPSDAGEVESLSPLRSGSVPVLPPPLLPMAGSATFQPDSGVLPERKGPDSTAQQAKPSLPPLPEPAKGTPPAPVLAETKPQPKPAAPTPKKSTPAPPTAAVKPVPVPRPVPPIPPAPIPAPTVAQAKPAATPPLAASSPPMPAPAVALALVLTPVTPASAPARNGATHRSAYLITPDELNRYRKENSLTAVPHAADEHAGLATHAEALGFAEWLTRSQRAAGTLSAVESYRLPLSSENKLNQVWAQDSTPQAANETKPFGIVRVRK